jgi:Ca2+-binding EF-hand superfamily protein
MAAQPAAAVEAAGVEQQLALALQRLQTMQAAVQQLRDTPGGEAAQSSQDSPPQAQAGALRNPEDAYLEYQRQTAAPSELTMPSKRERGVAFRRHDTGAKGSLTLAEVDRAVKELWPEHNFGNKQQIILSAYYAADDTGEGWINRKAFKALLEHLLYFDAEWTHFEAIDVDEHNQITLDGFKAVAAGLRIELSEDEADYIFDQLDDEGYGSVDFETFCSWAARRDLELGGTAGQAAGFQVEQERGWDEAAGRGSSPSAAALSLSAISGGYLGAADDSSWGAAAAGPGPEDAAAGESLEAALAAAEMSAPSWSDM